MKAHLFEGIRKVTGECKIMGPPSGRNWKPRAARWDLAAALSPGASADYQRKADRLHSTLDNLPGWRTKHEAWMMAGGLANSLHFGLGS